MPAISPPSLKPGCVFICCRNSVRGACSGCSGRSPMPRRPSARRPAPGAPWVAGQLRRTAPQQRDSRAGQCRPGLAASPRSTCDLLGRSGLSRPAGGAAGCPASAVRRRRSDLARTAAAGGSRQPPRLAKRPGQCLRFPRSLAGAGFVITSGLALGIDGAAHQGALDANGKTVAVLGTGIERLYPQRHLSLAKRSSNMAVRWCPNCRWTARHKRATFRAATASSAAFRWACWWSRRVRPAVR